MHVHLLQQTYEQCACITGFFMLSNRTLAAAHLAWWCMRLPARWQYILASCR